MSDRGETPDWCFRRMNRTEWAALYHTQMKRDFPPAELKPPELLAELEDRGFNTVWGAYRDETLTGYYVLAQVPGNRSLLLDYFAVLPRFRGRGYGGEILRHLRESLPGDRCLLIESENPQDAADSDDRNTRERRIAFYRRSGATLSPVTVRLFGVEYVLLTLGTAPLAEQIAADYQDLYCKMLPEGRFRENVCVRFQQDTE